jgi:threonine dehydrogenase-like Zn-dependent dehydrogenase
VYIEATGNPVAVAQGLQMIRGLGTFVEFSLMREPVTVDWTIIGDQKELNIHGSHLGPYAYPIAIDMLLKNQVPVDDIVNVQLPMASFASGIDMVHSGTESIKVMLVP